jgi:uncharacterized caspase-like protein
MPPVGVDASRFASALETGTAKLWVLLIGVNHYQDITFPSLRYAAIDCQGIGAALAEATQPFPHKEFLIHHDLVAQTPTLVTIESSLLRVVTEAKVQDTILIYFSGHGIVEPISQQTILCLQDTDRSRLLSTGLQIQVVLELLGNCAAHSQLLWLDACHSGNLSSIGKTIERDPSLDRNYPHDGKTLLNPTTQLLESLSHRAASSRGFYALLSCDEGQQSWEFPDLGHGVFSYYLMLGLSGEAADAQGIIDADGLYRYVYHQTMQYIDRTNQQVRLTNQAKRERGEMSCAPEYSHQTPKRIVSGVGEIILGMKPQATPSQQDRRALIIDAMGEDLSSDLDTLSYVLQQEGKFTVVRFSPPALVGSVSAAISLFALEDRIQTFLGETVINTRDRLTQPLSTRLLYLRGQITNRGSEDAWLLMGDGVRLSRTWLRQQLQQSSHNQQIVIIDAPGATAAAEWVEALKTIAEGQCIIVCASPAEDPELFTQVLLEALISAPPQIGVPVVSLFTRLQTNLDKLEIPCHLWLSGTQGLIEIVPRSEVETVKLVPAIIAQTEIPLQPADLESSPAPDITFGQDYTYSQLTPEKITPSSTTFRDGLESILYKLVGPIAPTLLTQLSKGSQVEDPATTIENVLLMLPAQSQAIFRQQAQTLLAQELALARANFEPQVLPTPVAAQSTYTNGRGIIAQPLAEITESAIRAYERELAVAIGPIAKFIVASTRKAQPQLSAPDLIAALASNIPDAHEADLFRRRCIAGLSM